MPDVESEDFSITRRLDRAIRREQFRTALKIAGVALLIVGILMGLDPFGPPISNTVVILKADPHAGLGLAQALPSGTARRIGFALALVGAIMLGLYLLLGIRKPRDGNGTV